MSTFTAKQKRFLVNAIFLGNLTLFDIYAQFYTDALEMGSALPHEQAMIKFRQYFAETPDGWNPRPGMTLPHMTEAVDEGGRGSGNFGHAGRIGKKGGSKAGTGGGDTGVLHVGTANLDDLHSEYQKAWSNWKQDNVEKMLLIMKDGKLIVLGTGEKGAVSLSMKQIDQILKDNGKGWHDIKVAIHNHDRGEAPSAGDEKAHRAFNAAGFGGDFQVYTPKTQAVQDVGLGKE